MTEPGSVLAVTAAKFARQSVGVKEDVINGVATNWGKWIAVYLKFVGIFSPAPWCCAFAMYKVWQAANSLGVAFLFPKTGSCSVLASWAQKNGRLYTTPPAYPCLFLVRLTDGKGNFVPGRYRHIGFMLDNLGHTVEGNSNNNGSAEGYEVVERERDVESASLHYVRI